MGFRDELRFICDKEGREVDFAITKDGNFEELIEVKWSGSEGSRSLSYYANRILPNHATQIVASVKILFLAGN